MPVAQHAYGRFMQSFYGGLAAIPEAAAVVAAKPAAFMESILPLEGGQVRRPEENLLFQGGQALREAIAKERPIDPNRPKSFLTDTLPSGAGSMASFIGTGGGLKALGVTRTAGQIAAGVAASGAAVGGAEAYREAVASGADDDTAFKVFAGNAALGTTEAVPIAGWLNRLNKASGNRLKRAIIEGSEELAQEVFQQYGGNLIARETYDPNRKLSEGLIEGGGAGFTLGSLMSLVVSAIGGRAARNVRPATDTPQADGSRLDVPPFFQPETPAPPATPSAEPRTPPAAVQPLEPPVGDVLPPPVTETTVLGGAEADLPAQQREISRRNNEAQAAQMRAELEAMGATAPQPPVKPSPKGVTDEIQEEEKWQAVLAPTTTALDPSQIPTVEVPVADIKLSKDVPNFKGEASETTGVVAGQELAGRYERRGTAPVVLWRRNNGDLEIITGRHRLDLARRNNEKTIPSQIVEEASGFTKAMALTFDAEANIRDGQGSIKDYAHYFKLTPDLAQPEAVSRGLLSRAKGKTGWLMARSATDDLYSLWLADKLTDEQATAIVKAAPGDVALQRVGVKQAAKGRAADQLANDINAAKVLTATVPADQMDMFGSNDAAIQQMERMSDIARAKQRNIQDDIRAISGASKNPERARALGVDVKNPAAVEAKLRELWAEKYRWDDWSSNNELVRQIRDEAAPKPTLELAAPESVAEQKSRLAQEAAAKKAQEAKDKLAAEAAAKLVGTAGDLGQGDLLGEPTDLFAPPAPKPAEKPFFDDATAKRVAELKAQLKAKLDKPSNAPLGTMGGGIDPELFKIGAELTFHYLKAGMRRFADVAGQLIADLGENARRYLLTWYSNAKLQLREIANELDTEALTEQIYRERFQPANGAKPDVSGSVGGSGGGRGRPGIRVARAELIPEPKQYVGIDGYAARGGFRLDPEQVRGINLPLDRFAKNPNGAAFLLADGPGVGKTAQELAIADQYSKLGLGTRILIVGKNKQIIEGRFKRDAEAMGIDWRRFTFTTFQGVEKLPSKDWDLVIWDEAHGLKNPEAQKTLASARLRAKHKLFATATPMDSPIGAAYFLSDITGEDFLTVANKLGFIYQERRNPYTNLSEMVPVLLPKFDWKKVWQNIIAYRDATVAAGGMIRREYPFYGKVSAQDVPMDMPGKMEQESIIKHFDRLIDSVQNPTSKRNYSGQKTLTLARWAEQHKLTAAVDAAVKHLASGGQVIIVTKTDKTQSFPQPVRGSVKGQNEKGRDTWFVDGAITQLEKLLKARGFTDADIAHIHDPTSNDLAAEVERFQTGKAKIALATIDSGGTGIDLDDQSGNSPRLMIALSKDFKGDGFEQLIGRVSRRNTKSEAEVRFLNLLQSYADERMTDVINTKLRTMRAIQGGEEIDIAGGLAVPKGQPQPVVDQAIAKIEDLPSDSDTRSSLGRDSFYSRLTRTVEQSQQGKATGAQWKATIRNSKLGANLDEMALVGVNELEDGKTYTKAELLEYLKANEVVVKDVTLGNPDIDTVQWSEVEAAFDNGPGPSELMDEFFGMQDSGKRVPKSALKEFSPQEQFDILKELNSRQEGLGDAVKSSKPARQTQFAAYQMPGAKEGSYREVLLTVPGNILPPGFNLERTATADGKGLWIARDSHGLNRGSGATEQDAIRSVSGWRDGHSQYSSIGNPVVRLRYNERTTSDGKTMLFLEEIQAPQKGEFEKMPALFQKNWREIAFKWALRKASSEGYDSLSWATGTQQAERYSLEKQISSEGLKWAVDESGKFSIFGETADTLRPFETTDIPADRLESHVGKDVARQMTDAVGRGSTGGTVTGEQLKIGGEGLKKLYDSDFRNVVNNLPAVKKAGQKVGTATINQAASYDESGRPQQTPFGSSDAGESVHSIAITQPIRESVMAGQSLFRRGGIVGEAMTQAEVESVVKGMMSGVIPSNFRFVNNPEAPRAQINLRNGEIELNLAKMDSPETVSDTVQEELIHAVWDSPEIAEARQTIEDLVTEVDRQRQQDEGYDPSETQEEAANEIARRLNEDAENANILLRAWRSIVAAIKRLFGASLNARESAVAIVREAMKNQVTPRDAILGAEPFNPSTVIDPATGERVPDAEGGGDIVNIAGQEFSIMGKDRMTPEQKAAAAARVQDYFRNELGLPGEADTSVGTQRGSTDTNVVFKIQPDGENHDAAGERLLAHLTEQIQMQHQPGGNPAYVSMLVNAINKNFNTGNLGQVLSRTMLDRLMNISVGESSWRGTMLRAITGITEDMVTVARNPRFFLRRTYENMFGGDLVRKIMDRIANNFGEHFTGDEIERLYNANPKLQELFNQVVDRLKVKPSLTEVIQEIFNTRVDKQDDIVQKFVDTMVNKFSATPDEAARLKAEFGNTFVKSFEAARVKAQAKALATLLPEERKVIWPGTPLWKKLTDLVNSGWFDSAQVVQEYARSKGMIIPTDAEIEHIRAWSIKEQSLKEPTLEEIESNDASEAKAAAKVSAVTLETRQDLLRKMNTLWSRWTHPIIRNPRDVLDPVKRYNTAMAANEWLTANLLLKLGFGSRQLIDVGTQMVLHTPTRAAQYAFEQWSNDRSAGRDSNLLDNLSQAITDAYRTRLKVLGDTLASFRRTLRGKGEQKNVEQLLSSIAVFDRALLKADEMKAAGRPAAARFLHLLALTLRFGRQFAAAADVIQGVPAEVQEMAHQIRTGLREQGKSKAQQELEFNTILGLLTTARVESLSEARQMLESRGLDTSKTSIQRAAWHILREKIYEMAQNAGLPADEWKAQNHYYRNVIGWNEPETQGLGRGKIGGPGGLVALAARGGKEVFASAGIPAFPFVFGNAMGISLNRKLAYTPLGFWTSLFKGSPWFEGERNIRQRKIEAVIGTTIGSTLFTLAALGLWVVLPRKWPEDEKEKAKWTANGWQPGMLIIPAGDQEMKISTRVGPMSLLSPYLAAGGAFHDALAQRAEKQAVLDERAQKLGLTAEKLEGLDAGQWLNVVGSAAYNAAMGGRTASGMLGTYTDFGNFSAKKSGAAATSTLIPGLPGYQEIARMAGANINPKLASFWDLLVPLPTSDANRVNLLGDPMRNENDVERVFQVLSGGTAPFPASSDQFKKNKAYANLFASDFRPPSINPSRGYQFGNELRPMTETELQRYTTARGKSFASELQTVDVNGLAPAEAKRAVQAAFQRANANALESVGATPPARATGASLLSPRRSTGRLRASLSRRSRAPRFGRVRSRIGRTRLATMRVPRLRRSRLRASLSRPRRGRFSVRSRMVRPRRLRMRYV